LVAPEERPLPPSSGAPGVLSAAGAVQVMGPVAVLAVGDDMEPTLPARDVFGELLKGFPVPALARDPLDYLASRLDKAIPTLEDVEGQKPLYFFPQVLRRVKRARELEGEASGEVKNLLESVQAAIGQSSFAEAVAIAAGGNLNDFSEEQLRDLTEAMETARGAALQPEDTLRVYDVLVPAIEALRSRDALHAEGLGSQLAQALQWKGHSLWSLGRTDDAFVAYGEVVERFGEATNTWLHQEVGVALLNQGSLLAARGRNEDALAAYQRGLERLSRLPDEGMLGLNVGQGLLSMSGVLESLGRREEAAAACDEVVARFGAATELGLRHLVREAQNRKRTLAAAVRPARASAPAKRRRPSTATKGQPKPRLRPSETDHPSTAGQRRQRRARE
jgi:tetratricopeptide (TPR) repeat protein